MIAPAPVKSHPNIEIGPAVPASEAGRRKTPEPIMLPTTRAVAIHRPIERFSLVPRMTVPFLRMPRSSRWADQVSSGGLRAALRASTGLGDRGQRAAAMRRPAARAVHPPADVAGARIARIAAVGRRAAAGDVCPRRAVRLTGQHLDGARAGAVD